MGRSTRDTGSSDESIVAGREDALVPDADPSSAGLIDDTAVRGLSSNKPLVFRGLKESKRSVTGLVFEYVKCVQSEFRSFNFLNCEFRRVKFEECTFDRCSFDSSDLRLVDGVSPIEGALVFDGCNLHRVAFAENSIFVLRKVGKIDVLLGLSASLASSKAKFLEIPRGAIWLNCRGASVKDCDFSGRIFLGGSFHAASMSGCSFEKSNLKGINFGGCDAVRTNFSRANLSGAVLHGRFKNCSFRGADLTKIRMAPRKSASSDNHVRFIDCDFRGAKLQDAQLFGAKFIRCRIRGKQVQRAHSKHAEFK